MMQSAESYQTMMKRLERVETLEAIRQGLEEAERGEGRPARDVFAEMKSEQFDE